MPGHGGYKPGSSLNAWTESDGNRNNQDGIVSRSSLSTFKNQSRQQDVRSSSTAMERIMGWAEAGRATLESSSMARLGERRDPLASQMRPTSSAGLLTGNTQPWYHLNNASNTTQPSELPTRPISTIGISSRTPDLYEPPRSKSAMAGTRPYGIDTIKRPPVQRPAGDTPSAHAGAPTSQIHHPSRTQDLNSQKASGKPDKAATPSGPTVFKRNSMLDTELEAAILLKAQHDGDQAAKAGKGIKKLERYTEQVSRIPFKRFCIRLVFILIRSTFLRA